MNKNKGIKGITLVALVITIIILLILAGITINQLTNSGLFNNAQTAKQEYENARAKEDDILKQYKNALGTGEIASGRDTVTLTSDQYKSILDRLTALESTSGSQSGSLATSNNYSTDEQEVGTWMDLNKPLYQKTIIISDQSQDSKRYLLSDYIDNFEGCYNLSAITANGNVPNNYRYSDSNYLRANISSDGYLDVSAPTQKINFPLYVTIQYTKTPNTTNE